MRFRLVRPVNFEDTTGWTRDMSGSGVFFTLRDRPERSLKAGEPVRLGIVMEHGDPRGGPVVVRCEGTILRVEPAPAVIGVVVVLESYQFDMPVMKN
jgi:hypothetical protein